MKYILEKLVDDKWVYHGCYTEGYLGNLFGACFDLGFQGIKDIRVIIEDEEDSSDK